MTEELLRSGKISILEGDITLPNLGLDYSAREILKKNANFFIHAAASINLTSDLRRVARNIIFPSLEAVELALSFEKLERFAFVSTAYANAFLHGAPFWNPLHGTCSVEERIYQLSDSEDDPGIELKNITEFGSTPEYAQFDHPFAYAYGKHLTERLLLQRFEELGKEDSLLIIRPACFGPAELDPFPHFEAVGSVPGTTFLAFSFADLWPWPRFPSHLVDPKTSKIDEIPVDVVANHLIVHIGYCSSGIVHASSRSEDQRSFQDMFHSGTSHRLWWWFRPTLVWCNADTPCRRWSPCARLFRLLGYSFVFQNSRTEALWRQMDAATRENWNLSRITRPENMEDFKIRSKNAKAMLRTWMADKRGVPMSLCRLFIS